MRYANVTKGYGVEVLGRSATRTTATATTAPAWEADDHADKSPAEYANEVVAYADAMKAVDPTIKIGAVLTTPGNWPDGIVGRRRRRHLEPDRAVDRRPEHRLRRPALVPGRRHRRRGAGQDRRRSPTSLYLTARSRSTGTPGAGADRIGISLTETQRRRRRRTPSRARCSSPTPTAACWSNGRVHRRLVERPQRHRHRRRRSPGRPTTATSACSPAAPAPPTARVCEPALNTPFAPYHALAHDRAGSPRRATSSSGPRTDRSAGQRARRPPAQRRSGGAAAQQGPGPRAHRSRSTTPATRRRRTRPTVYHVPQRRHRHRDRPDGHRRRADAAAVLADRWSRCTPTRSPDAARRPPGQPDGAGGVTDRTATDLLAGRRAGRSPIAKYEVYRQNGAVSEQLGETAGTSFTVAQPRPGHAGTRSTCWPGTPPAGSPGSSPPLTFTTGSPAASTLHGPAHRRQRLGQRLRRQRRHHQHRRRPGRAAGPSAFTWPTAGRASAAAGAAPGRRPARDGTVDQRRLERDRRTRRRPSTSASSAPTAARTCCPTCSPSTARSARRPRELISASPAGRRSPSTPGVLLPSAVLASGTSTFASGKYAAAQPRDVG